jgi:Asp/Glu/hydantoin racemase
MFIDTRSCFIYAPASSGANVSEHAKEGGNMPTVAAIYTSPAIVEPIKELFAEIIPGCRLINIVDDSLIQDVIRDGSVSPAVARRLFRYYEAAADTGADLIFNTCSSIGEVASAARSMLDIPLVKIDEPMAAKAVQTGKTLAVLATLPTTLAPTVRLVSSLAAQAGKSITVLEGLAKGAFEALLAKNPETHDRLIAETAEKLADRADAFVLAQGSMARMEAFLAKKTGKPVFSSPRLGVLEVKAVLERMNAR